MSKLFDAARHTIGTEAREHLARGAKSNIKIETLQRLGTSCEEILKVAEEKEVDFILAATHGYTGLKHFLLASTTERVVNIAPCPVLVVRQQERDLVS